MHEYLKTAPFDIYELHLFRLVGQHRSFTKAAQIVGLTQSAVTRQVQGIEKSLGVELLERTTRSVRLTPAGEALFAESERLIGSVDEVLQRFREEFAGAKKEIRVGVSRSVGLAYLPGFFHANIRRQPQIGYRVSYQSSAEVISSLESNRIDLGVLCPPPRLPATVRATHKFTDAFTVISPADRVPLAGLANRRKLIEWASSQDWLLLDETSNTGRRLRKWLASQGVSKGPTMQLDNFDLLINLVALGMGVSCVPIRALALYVGKRNIRRIQLIERFTRELVVIVRRHRRIPEHLAGFIENILF